jgi:hypothetical protein
MFGFSRLLLCLMLQATEDVSCDRVTLKNIPGAIVIRPGLGFAYLKPRTDFPDPPDSGMWRGWLLACVPVALMMCRRAAIVARGGVSEDEHFRVPGAPSRQHRSSSHFAFNVISHSQTNITRKRYWISSSEFTSVPPLTVVLVKYSAS